MTYCMCVTFLFYLDLSNTLTWTYRAKDALKRSFKTVGSMVKAFGIHSTNYINHEPGFSLKDAAARGEEELAHQTTLRAEIKSNTPCKNLVTFFR